MTHCTPFFEELILRSASLLITQRPVNYMTTLTQLQLLLSINRNRTLGLDRTHQNRCFNLKTGQSHLQEGNVLGLEF